MRDEAGYRAVKFMVVCFGGHFLRVSTLKADEKLIDATDDEKLDLLSECGFIKQRILLSKKSVPGQSGFNSRLDLLSVDL